MKHVTSFTGLSGSYNPKNGKVGNGVFIKYISFYFSVMIMFFYMSLYINLIQSIYFYLHTAQGRRHFSLNLASLMIHNKGKNVKQDKQL